ncbi:MAG: type II secretion system minor pseudopilin GspK [Agarilytica sp.]
MRTEANGLVLKKQRGVALIMAMMIVALIAVVATELSWRFELSMSRSGNRWAGIQARAYLEGAEQGAIALLRLDEDDTTLKESDHTGEIWAAPQQFPDEGNMIEVVMFDAHGRFNINMLKDKPPCNSPNPPSGTQSCMGAGACTRFTQQQHAFIRLLQTFDISREEDEGPIFLPQDQAEGITEAVIDWLDADSIITGFGGAESDHYESLEPKATIANDEMVSVSELQVMRGMLPQLYRQLLPNIIALPLVDVKTVNIQTATVNVLRSIKPFDTNNPAACDLLPFDEQTGARLESFIREAGEEGYPAIKNIKDAPNLPAEWGASAGQSDLLDGAGIYSVGQSNYFILNSTIYIGDAYVRRGISLLKRDTSGQSQGGQQGTGSNAGITIEVVRRTDANF